MFDILNLADEEAVVELTELYQNGNAKQTWQAKMTSKVVSLVRFPRNNKVPIFRSGTQPEVF